MIKKILKTAGLIVLILILLLTVVVVLSTVFQDERHMSPWGTGFFIIGSGSMEPNIPTGSIFMVKSVPQDKISVDDVLTFLATDWRTVVTHRVREINEDDGTYFYTTRGDANDTDDPPVRYERVIGRVVFVIPGSDFLILLLGNAHYLGIAVIALGFILCSSAVINGARKKAKKNKEEQEESSDGICTDGDEAVFDAISWEAEIDKNETDLGAPTEDDNEIDLGGLLIDESEIDLDTLLKDVDFDEIEFND